MRVRCMGALLTLVVSLCSSAHALTFRFEDGAGMAALKGSNPALYRSLRSGVEEAGREWGKHIDTRVDLTILLDYRPLGKPIANSSTMVGAIPYEVYRKRLAATADPASATDKAVLSALPVTGTPDFIVRNGSKINAGSVTIPQALAKVFGLVPATSKASDGALTLNSAYTFDSDLKNRIGKGHYDLISVAGHELGHILGMKSIVDNIGASPVGNYTPYVMDLFRFSQDEATGKPVRDLSCDKVVKYFSPDGRETGFRFCRGVRADRKEASHWIGNIGLMLAQITTGKRYAIRDADRQAMDAIGWNLTRN